MTFRLGMLCLALIVTPAGAQQLQPDMIPWPGYTPPGLLVELYAGAGGGSAVEIAGTRVTCSLLKDAPS